MARERGVTRSAPGPRLMAIQAGQSAPLPLTAVASVVDPDSADCNCMALPA